MGRQNIGRGDFFSRPKILNHVEPGVTAVYDRHSYDREKREALEAWSRRLQLLVSDLQSVKESDA
jgi:hypothetical protein